MTTNAITDIESFGTALASFPLKYKFIFRVLTETGFRISDVLNIKVRDVIRGKNITEKKTRKKRALSLDGQLKNELIAYAKTANLRGEDFLFPSTKSNLCRPISRSQVYRVFKAVATSLRLEGNVRVHSCRKTFAREFMAKYDDLKALQKNFNHSNIKTTKGYLD
jgi:integrase